jgi:asparagine synthetase B (glutamine-hydrolysing)
MDLDWYREVWPHSQNASGITRSELITGWPSGIDHRAPDIFDLDGNEAPVAALERALVSAISSTPCFVSFSGGRDSSVLLALATRVARREGFDDPVPLTIRFRDAPESEEADWQAEVVKHLRLNDWQVIEGADDIDLLGREWRQSLPQNGLRWPPSAHAVLPLLRAARGGALVHGEGGDQVFGGWRGAVIGDVLTRRRRFRRHDTRALVRAYAPMFARRVIEALRADTPAPWLRRSVRRSWAWQQGRAYAAEPRTWPEYLRWTRRERQTFLTLETLHRQSRSVGAELHTPFWNPAFLRALGRWGGRYGGGQRTALLVALFDGLLPDQVLRRSTKAHFTRAFFSETSREFARDWTGPVPEPEVVRREPLRAAWLSDLPPNTCAVLLQASWLLSCKPGHLETQA